MTFPMVPVLGLHLYIFVPNKTEGIKVELHACIVLYKLELSPKALIKPFQSNACCSNFPVFKKCVILLKNYLSNIISSTKRWI